MISERISDIRRNTSPNENFEYGYPHSNALLQTRLKLERCKPHKATQRHTFSTKCDLINDVKLFPTVYRKIYCRKFLTLSNQTSRYKCKCIRITDHRHSIAPRGKLYLQISNFVSITLYLFSYPSVKTCVLGAQKNRH